MRQLTFWHSASGVAQTLHVEVPEEAAPAGKFPGMADLRAAAQWLSGSLALPVALTLTETRSTMLSFRHDRGVLRLRLHRAFRHAEHAHMVALVTFLRGDRRAGKVLDAFMAHHGYAVVGGAQALATKGQVHDLLAIFDELNRTHFHGACTAAIGYGSIRWLRRKEGLKMGAYVYGQQAIYIHPCLDQPFVPRYYVSWLIYMQMLNELFGIGEDTGRRGAPPLELAVLQTCHPDYERCKAWEGGHLEQLKRFRPRPRRDRGVRKLPRRH